MKRFLTTVIVLLSISALSGCALWNKDAWSIDRLRDDRAVDIDQRLSSDEPIVQNPF